MLEKDSLKSEGVSGLELRSVIFNTVNKSIPYSLNDEQFDTGMESQDCAQCSTTLYTA